MQLIRPGVTMLDPIKQKPIGARRGDGEIRRRPGQADRRAGADRRFGRQRARRARHRPEDRGAAASTEFGDLEGVLAAAPAMKPSKRRDLLIEHADKARLSRELVTLRDDAPLPLPLEALHPRPLDPAKLAAWLTRARLPQHSVAVWGWRRGPAKPSRRPAMPPPGQRSRRDRSWLATSAPAAPVITNDFGPYETVRTVEALRAWVPRPRACRRRRRWIPKPTGWTRCAPKLVGFSLATAPGRACYVPLRHTVLARTDGTGRCDRGAGAAAERSRRAEGAAERQVRHAWCCAAPVSPPSRRSTTPC